MFNIFAIQDSNWHNTFFIIFTFKFHFSSKVKADNLTI